MVLCLLQDPTTQFLLPIPFYTVPTLTLLTTASHTYTPFTCQDIPPHTTFLCHRVTACGSPVTCAFPTPTLPTTFCLPPATTSPPILPGFPLLLPPLPHTPWDICSVGRRYLTPGDHILPLPPPHTCWCGPCSRTPAYTHYCHLYPSSATHTGPYTDPACPHLTTLGPFLGPDTHTFCCSPLHYRTCLPDYHTCPTCPLPAGREEVWIYTTDLPTLRLPVPAYLHFPPATLGSPPPTSLLTYILNSVPTLPRPHTYLPSWDHTLHTGPHTQWRTGTPTTTHTPPHHTSPCSAIHTYYPTPQDRTLDRILPLFYHTYPTTSHTHSSTPTPTHTHTAMPVTTYLTHTHTL